MKKTLIVVIIASFSFVSNAQIDTSKIEQYSKMVCVERLMSNKVTVDVDFGEARKFFGKDTRMKDAEGKLKKFNGVIDAINYMGELGWSLFNAYPISNGGQMVYYFFFKKTFNKSDSTE